MGHPKKTKKKYKTPSHPWQKDRLEEEKILSKEYGLKNKKELWKTDSNLRKVKRQAKKLIAATTEQAQKEKQQLLSRLFKYGLAKKDSKVEDLLELTPKDFFGRRLQTIVFKKNLARSTTQARQFIVHGHIFVNNKKITVPSYFVSIDEENKISYNPASSLSKEGHPEHVTKKELKKEEKEVLDKKKKKEVKKKGRKEVKKEVKK